MMPPNSHQFAPPVPFPHIHAPTYAPASHPIPPDEDETSIFDVSDDTLHASKNLLMGAMMARNGHEFYVAMCGAIMPVWATGGARVIGRFIDDMPSLLTPDLIQYGLAGAVEAGLPRDIADKIREAVAAKAAERSGPSPAGAVRCGTAGCPSGPCVVGTTPRDPDGVEVGTGHVRALPLVFADRVEVTVDLWAAKVDTIRVTTDNTGTVVEAMVDSMEEALRYTAPEVRAVIDPPGTAHALRRVRGVTPYANPSSAKWDAARETLTLTFARVGGTDVPVTVAAPDAPKPDGFAFTPAPPPASRPITPADIPPPPNLIADPAPPAQEPPPVS